MMVILNFLAVAAFLISNALAQAPSPAGPELPIIANAPVDPIAASMANLTGMQPALGAPSTAPMPSSAPMPSAPVLPVVANMPASSAMPSSAPMLPAVANMPTQVEPIPPIDPVMTMAPMVSPMMPIESPMMPVESPMMMMMPSMEPSMAPMMMGVSPEPSPDMMMMITVGPTSVPVMPTAIPPGVPPPALCPNTCRLSFSGVVGVPTYILNGRPDRPITPGITGVNFATALEIGEASVNGRPISTLGLPSTSFGLYAIGFRGVYGIGYRSMTPPQKALLRDSCVVVPITHYIDGAGTEVVVSTNPDVDCVAFRVTNAAPRTPPPAVPVLPIIV